MKTTVRTEVEAVRVSTRTLLKPGWHDGVITEAIEKVARSGNDCIELTVVIGEKTLRDWLSDADRGAAKLRHACEAVGALARYEAGEITQDDFPGHDVQVKIGIQKGTRSFPGDRHMIEDYRAAAGSRVVE
jgi:hypothetical protein